LSETKEVAMQEIVDQSERVVILNDKPVVVELARAGERDWLLSLHYVTCVVSVYSDDASALRSIARGSAGRWEVPRVAVAKPKAQWGYRPSKRKNEAQKKGEEQC
jgi:hypothetical protein